MRGEDDKVNVHSKLREGWEPVRKDQYPDFEAPVIDEGQYQGVIGHGGLMLCRMPAETSAERAAYYGGRSRDQMESVDQDYMKDGHKDMPKSSSRQSKVSFGGRREDSS